jgi:hypothetical protein
VPSFSIIIGCCPAIILVAPPPLVYTSNLVDEYEHFYINLTVKGSV